MIEFDAGQNRHRLGAGISAPPVWADDAGDDILEHRNVAERLNDLKGAADAEPRQPMGWLTGDIRAIEYNRSFGRANEAGDGLKQRCLAGAVRPDQPYDFIALQIEGNLIDSPQTAERAGQAAYLQQRRTHFGLRAIAYDSKPQRPRGASRITRMRMTP